MAQPREARISGDLPAILPLLTMAAVVVAAFASASNVQAATRTWDGGGLTNLWNDPLNWSLNLVPGPLDIAVFDGTSIKNATIDLPVSVQGLAINAGYTGTITQGAGNSLTVGSSDFVQAAGTFVGGDAVITMNDAFTLSGGSFTSTTATLGITGAVTRSAGTFAHNGGTVAFSGGATTINLGGAATFNNVQFLAGTKTISAGNTLTVLGGLDLVGGGINTGTLAAEGDIDVQLGYTGGGTATLRVNGGGAQTLTGFHTSLAGSLPNLDVAKPSGTLTIAGTLRTARNWTYTSGGLAAAGSTVIFNGTQTISGSHTLDAVELRGGAITIAAGTTLTVPGTLALTSGTLRTGTLAAQGDITIAPAFTGGTATLLINGAGAQTWSGSSNLVTGNLTVVNMNKPSGTLTLTASLRTGRNWTYTTGGLSASASNVIFTGQTITGSHALGAVEIRGGTVTIAAGTTITATGSLNLFSGGLNTGTLIAQGDIDAQVGFTGGGTATLLIDGIGAQTFTGNHTIAAGSLPNVNINKSAGTLTLAGVIRTARNWTHTAGTMTATGSTLIFNGTQTITGSQTLDAVDIRGGTVTVAAGTTLTVAGPLNLVSGSLGTGTLAAQGNIDAQVSYVGGGTATLLINGSGAQTLTGFHNSATGSLPNVNIAKPSGSLTLAGTLRTARNWTYTSGGLTTTGTTVIFNGTQTITGSHQLDAIEIRGGTVTIAAGTTLTAAGNVTLFSGSLAGTGTLAALADVDAASGFTGGAATLLINGSGAQLLSQAAIATSCLPVVNIAKPGGTLTMSGIFRTTRNWTYTSGGLSATGTSIQFAGTLTITGTHTLDAIEIRGGALTIAAGTTLTAAGTLNLFSGSLSTGTLAAGGDIDAQVTYTGGGTATLLINGSGAQTFTGFQSAAAGSLPNVAINKPSGTLTIAGTLRTARNWTYASGGLAAAGSTVIFNGTLTITGSHALDAVELRAGDVTVTPGDTLTVAGLLTLTDGNLNGGTVEALGDVVLQAAYDGETGTFRIAGTTDQTLTGSANSTSSDVASIVIDKPSGTLFLVGTIRMTTSSWTWLNGSIDPGASTMYFDSTVTINGTHSLFNVYLSGGTHTVAGGDTLTALGSLTLDNGTINGGTIAGAGPISQLSTFDGGSGLLEITGASDHTFTGSATAGAGTLPDLQIAKSGGTLTLAGTIRTTNDWTHVAGAVDPDGSTVVFAGTLTIDSGTMAFNDLLVNAGTSTLAANLRVTGDLIVAAGTLAIGANAVFVAGDVTIDGGLTVTTGMLDMNGLTGQTLGGAAAIGLYDLTINDPAGVTQTTTVSVAGTLDLAGPLTFNGQSLSIANAITGAPNNLTGDATSTLIINGNGSGIIIPSSLAALLDLAISNPNGVALAGPLTVEGTFTLAGGNLDAGGDVLSIGPTGTVSRTSGHVVGDLQKWMPAGSGVSLTYEIGDATTYAPVTLTFGTVGVTGQLTASTTAGEHPSIGSSPIHAPRDVNRWWTLTNAGIAFDTLDVVFTFAPTDVDPGAQTSQFIVAKWDGAWTSPTSGANTATTITASGMTSLSEFAVGEPAADLTVSKAGPASATAGASSGFAYTLIVHNAGPEDNAGGFTVTDTLPAGLAFQSLGSDSRCTALGQVVTCSNTGGLGSGADDTFVIHVTLASTVGAGTILNNSALVTSTGTGDPDGSNDSSAVVSTVVTTSADLADIVVDSPDPVVAGQTLTYTITVTNLGPSDAVGVTLNDALDAFLVGATYCIDAGAGCGPSSPWTGLVNLGTIAAGASVVVVISATVAPGTPDGTVIANTASAGATTPDPDSLNNLSSTTTQVVVLVPRKVPSPSASLADTRAAALAGQVSPLMFLLPFVAWLGLLSALAVQGTRRRNPRR